MQGSWKISEPIGALKCNFLPFKKIITDRPTDRPTDRRTDRIIEKLRFQEIRIMGFDHNSKHPAYAHTLLVELICTK